MKARILVVDDEHDTCDVLVDMLEHCGFEAVSRTSAGSALPLLESEDFDVVLSDMNMEGTSGLELCREVTAKHPDASVVIMTAFGSMETAVGAIRAGAYDFVTKPLQMQEIAVTIERAVGHKRLREEAKRLRTVVQNAQTPSEMIGSSAPMKKVYEFIARIAGTDAPVLVTGESGTGKELVAKAVHAASRRSAGRFVAINCAAIPEPLLESELFGHVKGAFTDARQPRQGLFREATGGTLLLDEIGEMPLSMQAKLLRVLQERTVRPVGSDREIPFDTRIIAATNRDLDTEVAERRFREDLFYRINVVRIDVPPLRSRANDALDLAQTFVTRYAAVHRSSVKGVTAAAGERLIAYSWPGNVRELQNCMESAVALAQGELLGVDDLPEKLRNFRPSRMTVESDDPAEFRPLDEVERAYVLRVLDAVNGNKTQAASVLGFDRRTLYRKLKRYGVNVLGDASDTEAGANPPVSSGHVRASG